MAEYVGYYRVSTKRQGKSGLGLESQKDKIQQFLKEDDVLVKEYIEIGSGMNNERQVLHDCIKFCKKNNYTLLIHKLDRFSRRVSFISRIMEENIKFIVTESPNSTPFQLHLYSIISEEERRRISLNTKQSLKMSKLRGVELGKHGKYVLSKHNKKQSRIFSKTLKSIIQKLRKQGESLSGISRYLNDNGYKTYRDKQFYPKTVSNIISYF